MPVNPGWPFPPIPPVRPVGILPAPLPSEQLPLPELLQAGFFVALLLAASVMDCRRRIIPNSICVLIAATGLISFSPARLLGPLASLPLLIAAMGKEGAMGGGDIKLTAAAGMVLGLRGGLWGMALGLAMAILFHGMRALVRRLRRKEKEPAPRASLPLAPFLSIGFTALFILNFGGL